MNKIHEWVNTGLILVVAILVLVGGNQSAPIAPEETSLGAFGTRFPSGLATGPGNNVDCFGCFWINGSRGGGSNLEIGRT